MSKFGQFAVILTYKKDIIMKRGQKALVALIVILTLSLTSCVNLKSVNDYSLTSLKSIRKFEEINYSFKQHCIDRCQFEAIRKFEIKNWKDAEKECACALYQQADSVTQLIYNAINGYFEGLSNLSNNNLTTYNFDALKNSLTEGNFGNVEIKKEQVDAYANISKILLRATMDLYRKKKIKDYVEQANEPIQILLSTFQFILQSNLEGLVEVKKEKLFSYYKDMARNNTLSEYEKGKAVIDYYQQLSDLNAKQKQIDAFAKGIKVIADGHQKLYDSRNKMTAKELREMLIQYASDIQNIISEFNKLKK